MLSPLRPLARAEFARRVERAVAAGDEDRALDLVAENPLALFCMLNVEGVLAGYLQGDDAHWRVFAGIAALAARWLDRRFHPDSQAERLAGECLRAQRRYLDFAFARLHDLDQDLQRHARHAHREATKAALARDQGLLDESAGHFREAVEAWRAARDPFFLAQTQADAAAVEDARGEIDTALTLLHGAIVTGQNLGDLECLGRRLLHRGKVHSGLGDQASARGDYREAAGVFRITRDHANLVLALVSESELHALDGNALEAEAGFRAAEVIALETRDPELIALVEETPRDGAATS